MSDTVGAHNDLHSEQGARPGEHPGRSRNPVIKVHDIAWLEFEKPDLVRAEAFALAFGFTTVSRTPDELHLRGTDAGRTVRDPAPRSAVAIRRCRVQGARRSRRAAAGRGDGRTHAGAARTLGGVAVDLVDPSGIPVHVVAGTHDLPTLPVAIGPHLQFRSRATAGERDTAAPARANQGAAARARRAADHQVHRGTRIGISTTSG